MNKLKTIKSIPKAKAPTTVVNLLNERYHNMPDWEKKVFITNMVSQTGRTFQTIYRWINGGKPALSEQKIVSHYLNERIDELFNHLNL